ncbi:DUF4365 domain-containing protein [Tautonia marina]|uniref:DUF4365 domain-containing protein n=1 Tax=Tautonia marina TaxID=2653855 RepID=UPI0013758A50|nr:DUF4365 domain-containing protein [Tautonia marina]
MGKTTAKPWYFEERAESLLMVHLTRRDDLEIQRQALDADRSVDYLVHITSGGRRTGRVLGIELKALRGLKPGRIDESRPFPLSLNLNDISYPIDIPFPFCLVVFDIENDHGFYRWLKEPTIDPSGRPGLVDRDANWFRRLDRDALDEIINQVNQWYEHRISRS